MSKISFILPAYKRAFLKEAIESILAQTYVDFELVVVDDNSPEHLDEVVKEFKDPRLTYYHHEVNLGGKSLIDAWEYAMQYAKGEWCVLASDDDMYAPEYLAEMMALTEKYPKAHLFHSRAVKVDSQGKWLKLGEVRAPFESQIEMAYSRGVRGFQQTAPDFMFRLSAFKALGGFVRFPLAWYSDDATWFELAKNGVGFTEKPLFLCRVSGINISGQANNLALKLQAAEEFKAWFVEFASRLVATSKTDEVLRRNLEAAVCYVVDEFSREQISALPWLKRIVTKIKRRLTRR